MGDTIVVYKSGDIIPQVRRVEMSKRPAGAVQFDLAAMTCPECGGALASENGSVDLYCQNPACPAKAVQRIVFFASKDVYKRQMKKKATAMFNPPSHKPKIA